MKTEIEIREKINSLEGALKKAKSSGDYHLIECIACQINMLLWTIGDKDGAVPLDERIDEILEQM